MADVARVKWTQENVFPDDPGGLSAVASASHEYQSFGIGYFRLAEGRTLLVEVAPPRAKCRRCLRSPQATAARYPG